MTELRPVSREYVSRQPIPEHDVHRDTGRECQKRPQASARQVSKAGSQADTQEAENERPGAKTFQRGNERRDDVLGALGIVQ